jgi:hypothetical protein
MLDKPFFNLEMKYKSSPPFPIKIQLSIALEGE